MTSVVSQPGEAYLTLGTGTRAVAPREVAGLSFEAEDAFGATHRRRRVRPPARPRHRWARSSSLGWTLLEEANEDGEFGGTHRRCSARPSPTPASGRGVVANADGADPLVPGEPIHREAALALADADRRRPVRPGRPRPARPPTTPRPFGVRLDERRP